MGVCLNLEFDDITHDYYLMHDLHDYAAFFQLAELVSTISPDNVLVFDIMHVFFQGAELVTTITVQIMYQFLTLCIYFSRAHS